MAKELHSLVVIGGGKMGSALVEGWLACDQGPAACLQPSDVTVVNPGAERREYLECTYGVACVADSSQAPFADVVVLAVKPQVMFDGLVVVRANPALCGGTDGPLFISIAAGLSCERLAAALPANARLVRVMPNMPLAVGAGASGVCGLPETDSSDIDLVASLFESLGQAVVVDESLMDAVCALSGSGPAYVALFIEALRDGAVAEGLDADLAEALALETVYGTALQLKKSGQRPADLRISVCSPGGTTLAGLDAINQAGFSEAVHACVAAAAARSKELSQC